MDLNNKDSQKITFQETDKSHLLEIVKMRTDALVNYSNRVWKIFNWFQTLNVAILGLILTKQVVTNENIFQLATISLLLFISWFFIGLNDFLSTEKHKKIKNYIEKYMFTSLNIREELDQEKNSPKGIITLLGFNQTKTLFISPIIKSIISIIIIVNNF